MEYKYYIVAILSGPENDADDIFNPKCYPESYEDAAEIARPWVEQGYEAVISMKKYEEIEDN